MKKHTTLSTNGSTEKRVLKRIPRPQGATSLATEAFLSKDDGLHKNYVDFMINHWLLSNGSICGTVMDINAFSVSLGVTVEDIRLKMRDRLIHSRVFDKDKQEQLLMGLFGELVSWTMEDRMRINSQIEILTRSQGGKYTPFISAELNKAMKLGLESGTALQGVISN